MDSEKRFIELGWKILEYKAVYYNANLIHSGWLDQLTVEDAIYDKLENEYRDLAKRLDLEPSAADAVGFPIDNPSAQLVLAKLKSPPNSTMPKDFKLPVTKQVKKKPRKKRKMKFKGDK